MYIRTYVRTYKIFGIGLCLLLHYETKKTKKKTKKQYIYISTSQLANKSQPYTTLHYTTLHYHTPRTYSTYIPYRSVRPSGPPLGPETPFSFTYVKFQLLGIIPNMYSYGGLIHLTPHFIFFSSRKMWIVEQIHRVACVCITGIYQPTEEKE